jgi:subtilisin family serine protease
MYGAMTKAALTAALMSAFIAGTAGGAQSPAVGMPLTSKIVSNVFIVQLAETPVASYAGGLSGFPATRPAAGTRLNKSNVDAQGYAAYLRSRHDAVAASVGAARLYDYEYSFNGFAAPLNDAQVAALLANPGVISVVRDKLSHTTTDNTPTFLGLTGPGLWSQLGGQAGAGENVIIGVIDTGIWPEHPSFAAAGYGPPPQGWTGSCEPGELWSRRLCNNKLIGARYFEKSYGHFFGDLAQDYQSARDHDGHGTHAASTAGGNANVPASVLGIDRGTISGIAPRARIAAYKACWPEGCFSSDLVAAIDAAVGDGVDVINYSIGISDSLFLDPDQVAFLFARAAGVFVAASAGNSGPASSTTENSGPWLTTVAASTQDRNFIGTVTLGNGLLYTGPTLTAGLTSRPLVDATAAGSDVCLVGQLNPGVVNGKIVLCKRGENTRVEKSLAVKQAGGVGMIMYNIEPQTLMVDTHWVPSIFVSSAAGAEIKSYIATAGASATASLSGGTKQFGDDNIMASFSSRGPLVSGTGDVLKPDVTAPGVNVLAGSSPTAWDVPSGNLFQVASGTSMSTPHVAGIAALLKQLRPNLTPAELQSAITTTARQDVVKEDGTTPANPFDFGGGHVRPNAAADPGLVYPATFENYRAFLRSQGVCQLCFGTTPPPEIAATDLNLPSLTVSALAGTRSVSRTVRNVGPAAATYTVVVDAPPGINVLVSPSTLTLAAGETATYHVTFTTTDGAAFDEWAFGSLTWSDATHSARSPLVIRPVPLIAPDTFASSGSATGSTSLAVHFGYSGPFETPVHGLVPASTEARTVSDDKNDNFNVAQPDSNQGIQVHAFSVPAGTLDARFRLFDEFTDGDDDLDLYLYNPGGSLVAMSRGPTSAEVINVHAPEAGNYKLYVHGRQTQGPSAVYTLFSWMLNSSDAGNMTATPSPNTATAGGSGSVAVSWSGLTTGTKYFGRVGYSNGVTEFDSTLVEINP